MVNEGEANRGPTKREISMAARATIELFENGAVAKTRERFLEVEAEGDKEAIDFWRLLLAEVERLHRGRQTY